MNSDLAFGPRRRRLAIGASVLRRRVLLQQRTSAGGYRPDPKRTISGVMKASCAWNSPSRLHTGKRGRRHVDVVDAEFLVRTFRHVRHIWTTVWPVPTRREPQDQLAEA